MLAATSPWSEQMHDQLDALRAFVREQVEARFRAEARIATLEQEREQYQDELRLMAAWQSVARKHGASLRAMNVALLRVSAWHTEITKSWPSEESNGIS